MRLFINGEEKAFADSLNLAQLIEHLGMKGDRVAVELNREIVSRTQWPEMVLNDGDRLEIVHFVGGGSGSSGFEFPVSSFKLQVGRRLRSHHEHSAVTNRSY